jgi:hypothetical protein
VTNVRAHSFDAPHERPAPASFSAQLLDGTIREFTFTRRTLVAAIKPQCDGCLSFLSSDFADFAALDVVVVSASAPVDEEWANATNEVFIAPTFLNDIGVHSPPHFVVIDPAPPRVVTEGVLFSPQQVADEIARALAP